MKLYSAIDLHSTNHVLTNTDEQDQTVFERRLPNALETTLMGGYIDDVVMHMITD